jgi:predicted DsbA family dithiol-disulfide isomerase
VRKTLLLTALLGCAFPLVTSAEGSARDKIAAYFRGWYAHVPGSEVVVNGTKEVTVSGLEAWRVERKSTSKSHQESNVVLYDPAAGEIFVGDVFHDPDRAKAGRPLDPGRDVPDMEAALRDLFGLPVKVELQSPPRGALRPLTVSVLEDKEQNAYATRAGFVSGDGATLMLGEFRPSSESPAAFRAKLLGERPGVRVEPGRFTVTEFMDFQCDRCRVRTPDVRRLVLEKGGTVEIRFLPLVKQHAWAFAAAESAAALFAVKPELYRRYEESVFARSEGMSVAAARELASDIASAAGAGETYAAEIASGRARGRVLSDISLAMRLGIVATPSFLYRGALVPGEKGQLEDYLFLSLRAPAGTPVPAR